MSGNGQERGKPVEKYSDHACQAATTGRGTSTRAPSLPCVNLFMPVLPGTGSALVIQSVFRKRLPYPPQWNILLSVVAGSVASYVVTKRETEKCNNLWIYLEKGQISQLHDAGQQEISDSTKENKYGDSIE